MRKRLSMNMAFSLIIALTALILVGCKPKTPSPEDLLIEKSKILELFKLNEQALLNRDLMLIRKTDKCTNDSWYSISRGNIEIVKNANLETDEELINLYNLKDRKYTSIINEMEPIVKFSPDGKMAYYIGKIHYVYEYTDSTGKLIKKEITDACLGVLEKKDTCWGGNVIAETFE
jgi:hypothetical protein